MQTKYLDNLFQAVLGDIGQKVKNKVDFEPLQNDGNASFIIWSGSYSDIQNCFDTQLNFGFRFAVIKYPSFVTQQEVSSIIQKVQENKLPEYCVLEVASSASEVNHNITVLGFVKFLEDQTGFTFTEDMPSPVEAEFRKRFMKICNLLGKDYTVYQFENRNLLLTSAQSYELWIDVLAHCFHEPCQDWEQLLTEIKEARRLIDGKFNLHAIIAKETAKQGNNNV